MECNVCLDKDTLYLYSKGSLIYSLCKHCISTQLKLDRFYKWQRDQIVNARKTGEIPF
jgi:hypothetical protein